MILNIKENIKSDYGRKIKRCGPVFNWIILLGKYSMYKRWVTNICPNAICSNFSCFLTDIDDWSLVSYNSSNLFYGNQNSTFLLLYFYFLLCTVSWLYCMSFTLFLSWNLSWKMAILMLILRIFDFIAHNNHSELLFHYKVILLHKLLFISLLAT